MDRIGIIVALAREALCLLPRVPRPEYPTALDEHYGVLLCGIGPERARRAAAQFIALGAEGLVSFGSCAGLAPGLHSGALVIPETVLFGESRIDAHDPWRRWVLRECESLALPARGGSLLTVDRLLADAGAKQQAACRTGAVAADMESGAILAEAQQRGVPAIALRVVLDDVDTALPAAVTASCDAYGNPRWPLLLGALLRHPSLCAVLLRLAGQARRAETTLRRIAEYRQLLRIDPSMFEAPPAAGGQHA